MTSTAPELKLTDSKYGTKCVPPDHKATLESNSGTWEPCVLKTVMRYYRRYAMPTATVEVVTTHNITSGPVMGFSIHEGLRALLQAEFTSRHTEE